MEKKSKSGLQVRFNPDTEPDVIEFFSLLKKAEVHITAVSAFRMYMRSIGFYEKRLFERMRYTEGVGTSETISRIIEENEGHLNKEAFKTLNGMFETENQLED